MNLLNKIDSLFKENETKIDASNGYFLAGIPLSKAVKYLLSLEGTEYSRNYIMDNIYNLKIMMKEPNGPGKVYPKSNIILKKGDSIFIKDKKHEIIGDYMEKTDGIDESLCKNYLELLLNHINDNRKSVKLESIFDEELTAEEICFLFAVHVKFYDCIKDRAFKVDIIKFFDSKGDSLYKRLYIKENDPNYEKIEKLQRKQNDIESKIKYSIENLNDLFKIENFQKEFRGTINTLESSYLFKPFLKKELINNATVDTLFKPFIEVLKYHTADQKLQLFNKCHDNFDEFIKEAKESGGKTKEYLLPLGEKLFTFFKEEIFGESSGNADLTIEKLNKKYPLHTENFNFHIKLKNLGSGFANNVKISALSDDLIINDFRFEINSFMGELTINVPIRYVKNEDTPIISFYLEWTNIDYKKVNKEILIDIEKQDKEIPWKELKNRQPYMLVAVTEKEKLLGRDDIIEELVLNILSKNITSFIIYGQKRVGKTSVVKAIENYFNGQFNNIIIAYVDSNLKKQEIVDDTINRLVLSTCKDIKKKLILKYKDNHLYYEKISNIQIPVLNGSLAPIEDFFDDIELIFPDIKIVLIIDEFDELGYDLYVPNNKSETFFNNLRGLNNKSQNFGIILVGSENMTKIYNWHGQRLNNWKNRQIDTFDIKNEYDTYKKLIENPVAPYLNFQNEALFRIYNLSGGNPYFTNMICSWIFEIAFDRKDTDITEQEVDEAISLRLKKDAKTSFQHFWMDGILEAPSKKDFIYDLRRRTLKAIADAMNEKQETFKNVEINIDDIKKKFIKPPQEIKISKNECENQLNDFINRDILINKNSKFRLHPELFEIWLIKYGNKEIIEGLTDIEDIIKDQEMDEEFKLKEEEILFFKKLFKNDDKYISIDIVKEWFAQFDTNYIKRYFFNLLKNVKYYDNINTIEIFKYFGKTIFKDETIMLEKYISLKRFRQENSILTYFDYGREEKEIIAKKFSKFIKVPYDMIYNFELALKHIDNDIKHLIILEPVLDNFDKLIDNLEIIKSNLLNNKEYSTLKIHIITILGIDNSISDFNELLKDEYSGINFICHEIVEENKIKPFINLKDERIFKTLNNKLISLKQKYYDFDNCINVSFETICPQYSIPFYWNINDNYSLFPNTLPLYFISENLSNEKYRDKSYKIGKELEQTMLNITKKILQRKYNNSDNEWWVKGVPQNIRQKCAIKREDEDQIEHESSYLEFIDFSNIVKENFQEMKDYFCYDLEKGLWSPLIGKDKGINWLNKLNKIRRKYAHVVKSPPSKEEFEFLKKVTDSFFENLKVKYS